MRLVIIYALFAQVALLAQQTQPLATQQPDCRVFFYMTAASSGVSAPNTPVNGANGVSGVIDNRQVACDGWVLAYSNFGFSALSLRLQSAPNGSSALPTDPGVPGTWATFGGTIVQGSNPSTVTTQTEIQAGKNGDGYFPFLRVNVTSATGSGIIIGELHGFKTNINAGGGAAGACVGTTAAPCRVAGPTASGQGVAFPPVLIGGATASGGGQIQQITVSSDGGVNPAIFSGFNNLGSTSDGFLDGNIITPAGTIGTIFNFAAQEQFNGSTWDRGFVCASSAFVNMAASGNLQIVAASGSTIIRICHISMSTTAAEDFKLTTGTGANCAAGTADLTGLYKSVQAFDFEYTQAGTLRTAAGKALCVNQSANQATGVTITFAQY